MAEAEEFDDAPESLGVGRAALDIFRDPDIVERRCSEPRHDPAGATGQDEGTVPAGGIGLALGIGKAALLGGLLHRNHEIGLEGGLAMRPEFADGLVRSRVGMARATSRAPQQDDDPDNRSYVLCIAQPQSGTNASPGLALLDLTHIAHRAPGGVGGERRVGPQCRRHLALAADRLPRRLAPRFHLRAPRCQRRLVKIEAD